MAKISLNKLNLEKNTNITTVEVCGQQIEVLNYLPAKKKMDIIEVAIQDSVNGTIVNPIALDVYFHMYMILSYTNLSFSKAQMEDLAETYDLLEKNGVVFSIVSAIPENEYSQLTEALAELAAKVEDKISSLPFMLKESLDLAINSFSESIKGVDFQSEDIKNVLKIATDNMAK